MKRVAIGLLLAGVVGCASAPHADQGAGDRAPAEGGDEGVRRRATLDDVTAEPTTVRQDPYVPPAGGPEEDLSAEMPIRFREPSEPERSGELATLSRGPAPSRLAVVAVRGGCLEAEASLLLELESLLYNDEELEAVLGLGRLESASELGLPELAEIAAERERDLLLVDVHTTSAGGERVGYLVTCPDGDLVALFRARQDEPPAPTGRERELVERIGLAWLRVAQ